MRLKCLIYFSSVTVVSLEWVAADMTVNGCRCQNTWSPGLLTCPYSYLATYTGCGMVMPCDGDNRGECGLSWCRLADNRGPNCTVSPQSDWDYCRPPPEKTTTPFWLGPYPAMPQDNSPSGSDPPVGNCDVASQMTNVLAHECKARCVLDPTCSATTFTGNASSTFGTCRMWRCAGTAYDILSHAETTDDPEISMSLIEREPDCCVATTHDDTSHDEHTEHGRCVFPFEYDGKVYWNCTTVAHHDDEDNHRDENAAWCATRVVDKPVDLRVQHWAPCRCQSLASLHPVHSTTMTTSTTGTTSSSSLSPTLSPSPLTAAPTASTAGDSKADQHKEQVLLIVEVTGGALCVVVVIVGTVLYARRRRHQHSEEDDEEDFHSQKGSRRNKQGYSMLELPGNPQVDSRTLREFLTSANQAAAAAAAAALIEEKTHEENGYVEDDEDLLTSALIPSRVCTSSGYFTPPETSAKNSRRSSFSSLRNSRHSSFSSASAPFSSIVFEGQDSPLIRSGAQSQASIDDELVAARPDDVDGDDFAAMRRAVRDCATKAQSRSSNVSPSTSHSQSKATLSVSSQHWSKLQSVITTGAWKYKVSGGCASRPSMSTVPENPAARHWDMLFGVIQDGIARKRLRDVLGTGSNSHNPAFTPSLREEFRIKSTHSDDDDELLGL